MACAFSVAWHAVTHARKQSRPSPTFAPNASVFAQLGRQSNLDLRFARTFRAAPWGSIGVGVIGGVLAATQWGPATGATIALTAAALFALGLAASL